ALQEGPAASVNGLIRLPTEPVNHKIIKKTKKLHPSLLAVHDGQIRSTLLTLQKAFRGILHRESERTFALCIVRIPISREPFSVPGVSVDGRYIAHNYRFPLPG
ncbi:hypothetical protein, partial [Gluconobacter thailandicus]